MADDDVGPFDPVTLQPRDTPPLPGWSTPASRAPFPPAPDVTGRPTDVMGMFRESEARRAETEAGRREQTEPMTDELVRQLGRPVPEMPKLQKTPEPPKSTFGDDMRGWMQSAMLLAAIGGAIGRKHITNALTAFSGAVEGFKNGRLDDAKQKMEEWRAQSEQVGNNNKELLDQYNAALKSQSADLDQKMNAVKLIASKWHDRAAYDAASTNNITELARYLEQLQYHNENMAIRREQLANATRKLDHMIELQGGHALSPGAKELAADMFIRTGQMPPNIGRGVQGPSDLRDILNLVETRAREQGLTAEQIAAKKQEFQAQGAGLRTTYQQEAKLGTAIEEISLNAPALHEAFKNLDRGTLLTWNRVLTRFDQETQDPRLADLRVKLFEVTMSYAQVAARGAASTEGLRAHADSLLSTMQSVGAAEAALNAMEWEAKISVRAPQLAREKMLGREHAPQEQPPLPGVREPGLPVAPSGTDRTNDPAFDQSKDPFGIR